MSIRAAVEKDALRSTPDVYMTKGLSRDFRILSIFDDRCPLHHICTEDHTCTNKPCLISRKLTVCVACNSAVFAAIFCLLFLILSAVCAAVLAVLLVVAGAALAVVLGVTVVALLALVLAVVVPACIIIMPIGMAASVCDWMVKGIYGKLCANKQVAAAVKDNICNGAWHAV